MHALSAGYEIDEGASPLGFNLLKTKRKVFKGFGSIYYLPFHKGCQHKATSKGFFGFNANKLSIQLDRLYTFFACWLTQTFIFN